MAVSEPIVMLDGAHGEGGGALLRSALAMAVLTQQAVRVTNVRAGTKFPGLDVEDVVIGRALAACSGAEVTGLEPGGNQVTFRPAHPPRSLNGTVETLRNSHGRGPSATIVLASLLPVLARAGAYSTLTAEGETHGMHSLSYDYFERVTLRALRQLGLYAFPLLERAGYGRESRGAITLDVEPSALTGVEWSARGQRQGIYGTVTTSGLPQTVAERGIAHLHRLAQAANLPIEVEHVDVPAENAGAFVTVFAQYERGMGGGAAMGSRGVRMETLAQTAFDETLDWMSGDATVDPYLADQVVLAAVLGNGPSTFKVSRLTARFLTIVWVVKQFTPIHLTVRGTEGGPGVISVQK